MGVAQRNRDSDNLFVETASVLAVDLTGENPVRVSSVISKVSSALVSWFAIIRENGMETRGEVAIRLVPRTSYAQLHRPISS